MNESGRLDKYRLREIVEREACATAGPWRDCSEYGAMRGEIHGRGDAWRLIATVDRRFHDAAFIAHARTDIPDLCDEVRTLDHHLAGALEVIDSLYDELVLLRMQLEHYTAATP
ncbi:MAG: hypothetical protein NVSMB64_16820 [Candidatus Velthaea sp.]